MKLSVTDKIGEISVITEIEFNDYEAEDAIDILLNVRSSLDNTITNEGVEQRPIKFDEFGDVVE